MHHNCWASALGPGGATTEPTGHNWWSLHTRASTRKPSCTAMTTQCKQKKIKLRIVVWQKQTQHCKKKMKKIKELKINKIIFKNVRCVHERVLISSVMDFWSADTTYLRVLSLAIFFTHSFLRTSVCPVKDTRWNNCTEHQIYRIHILLGSTKEGCCCCCYFC